MKTFLYKAKNGPDEVIEGRMAAPNAESVVSRLARKGYVATYVEPELSAKKDSRGRWSQIFGVRPSKLISFTRQMATLLRSGIPLLRGLIVLSEQTKDRYLSHVLNIIAEKVKNGQSLSSSLIAFPNVFSPFYVSMVKSGEDSGALDKSLARVSDYYQKQMRLNAKVRAALVYPVLVLGIGILTIFFVFTNVMPRIVPILLNLNTELPLPTKMLIGMSSFMKSNWMWLALAVVIFALIFHRAMKNKIFRRYLSKAKLKLPIFGNLIYKSELARFVRALEISLENGIPIINAISISVPILNEVSIKERLNTCVKSLEVGESMSKTFKDSAVFPPFVINLVSVGEESGNLSEVLSEVAGSFEEDCGDAVTIMVNLLEPVMVLGIGLVVGFIVSAVLLPIFQLNIMKF